MLDLQDLSTDELRSIISGLEVASRAAIDALMVAEWAVTSTSPDLDPGRMAESITRAAVAVERLRTRATEADRQKLEALVHVAELQKEVKRLKGG